MATRKRKAILGTARMAAAEAALETPKARLVAALNPSKVRVTPMFHAILAVLLGEKGWASPNLVGLCITSDDFLLGMREGDIGYNDFLGSAADLRRNIRGVCEVCEVSDQDRDWLLAEVEARKS